MKKELTKEVKEPGVLKTIYERRAVRKYKDNSVDPAIISKILDAGRMAPSAMNKQPWKFYILTNKKTIKSFSKEIGKIAAKYFLKAGPRQIIKTIANLLEFPHSTRLFKGPDPVFHEAPVVIFITASRKNEWAALDVGMCSENIMLAAKSFGLDSCPVGFGKFVEQTKIFSQLHVPSEDQVHLAIIIGYGDENPEVHKRITDNAFFIDPIS